MNGFLNLLKPPGMSSGAAVAVVKRLTGEKVGHAGTLDPEAAGVLPIMVGKAARLLNYFTDKSKTYVAQIAFAGETDTQDAQGVLIRAPVRVPDRAQIEGILPSFTGVILQRPPAYSAIKMDGRPLYALARQGHLVEAAARETEIRRITLGEKTGEDGYMMEVDCGSGTYIRTLCHDMGRALGAPAHMRFLLRTRSGAFSIEDAVTVEEAVAAASRGELEKLLLPMETPLEGMPRLDAGEAWKIPVLNGAKLPSGLMPGLAENGFCRVYYRGCLAGIAHKEGPALRFDMGLIGEAERRALL